MRYAIRLKTGNLPTIVNEEGEKISLTVGIGEEVHYEGVYYKGKVKVNLAGKWEKGFNKPLSVDHKPPSAGRYISVLTPIFRSTACLRN